MATNIREFIKKLPKKRQEEIAARAQVLIKEELNLQELRKAQQLTKRAVRTRTGVSKTKQSPVKSGKSTKSKASAHRVSRSK